MLARLTLAIVAAALGQGCALHRGSCKIDIFKPEGAASCRTRVETTTAAIAGYTHHSLVLKNDSSGRCAARATVLSVRTPLAPFPRLVATPAGWVSFLEMCPNGRDLCGVEWRSFEGVAPGAQQEFAIDFPSAATLTTRLEWRVTVGTCDVVGPGAEVGVEGHEIS
jgi:hypothetical protein